MSIYQASFLADNGLEYEARIANMINEGGIGVEAYYNYGTIKNKSQQNIFEENMSQLDIPQEKNITRETK